RAADFAQSGARETGVQLPRGARRGQFAMKIHRMESNRPCCGPGNRSAERGFLVITLLIILTLMLIYVTVSVRLLSVLTREIRLVEKAQIQRLERAGAHPA